MGFGGTRCRWSGGARWRGWGGGGGGERVGCWLGGMDKGEGGGGGVLAKRGSIKPRGGFRGGVYVLGKEEGGRHTPFFQGYRPQFYFRTTDVTGVCTLP